MRGIIIRTVITAAGLWLADTLLAGVRIDGGWTLVFAALVLGIINAIIRPVLLVITIPITVITLGLFILVLNAAMFGLAAALFEGFSVDSFWSALAGTIIVSITAWAASSLIGPSGRYEVVRRG